MKQQSTTPIQKVSAAALGGGVAGAVVVILAQIAEANNIQISQEVQAAVIVLITAVLPFVAGYVMPPGENDGPVEK